MNELLLNRQKNSDSEYKQDATRNLTRAYIRMYLEDETSRVKAFVQATDLKSFQEETIRKLGPKRGKPVNDLNDALANTLDFDSDWTELKEQYGDMDFLR